MFYVKSIKVFAMEKKTEKFKIKSLIDIFVFVNENYDTKYLK